MAEITEESEACGHQGRYCSWNSGFKDKIYSGMWICTNSLPPSMISLQSPGSHGRTQPPALPLRLSAVSSTEKSVPRVPSRVGWVPAEG